MPSQTGSIDLTAQVSANNNAKDYSDNVVDDLEIGGRNLLRYRIYNYADGNNAISVNSSYRGMYCAIDGGETYTISRNTIEGNRFWIEWSEQEPASGVSLHLLSNNNTAMKVTVDAPSEANWLFIYLSNQSDEIHDGNIKIERGTKATDWTPAPEDQEALANSLNPFVVGTQTTATYDWTGNCPELSELKDGQQITYFLPYSVAGSQITASYTTISSGAVTNVGGASLTLTLANNVSSGQIPIWYGSGMSRVTSHYAYGSVLHLTYRENVTMSGTYHIDRGWFADANYNTDTVYSRTLDGGFITGLNGAGSYSLHMKDANGNWTNIVKQYSTGNTHTVYTGGLKFDEVLYNSRWYTNGIVTTSGTSIGGSLWSSYILDFRYSANVVNTDAGRIVARKPVYLVGTVGSDGLFYLDTTKWWTQTLPTSVDNKVYLYIGTGYDWYRINLQDKKTAYIYHDGKIKEYDTYLSDIAAQTATTYITHVDNNGITIHPSSNTNNRVGINANGMTVYKGGYLKANFADTITLYGGSNASGANPKVEITSSQFKMTSSDGTQRIAADSSTGVVVGNPSKGRVVVNDTGITIYDTNNRRRTAVDSDGLKVYAGTDSTEVAHFTASGAQIGKTGESRIVQDYHSLQMVDKEGNAYFYVSDLRGTDGTLEIVDTWRSDGTSRSYTLSYTATDTNYTVTVSDGSGGTVTKSTTKVTFDTYPSDWATITVTYRTANDSLKAYTFGKRDANAQVGAMSIAEGLNTAAIGRRSHASGDSTKASGSNSYSGGHGTTAAGSCSFSIGNGTTANGWSSFAGGYNTTANGNYSHAEGYETEATGDMSHVHGWYTVAGSDYQTVIGTFNNNQTNTAFEIGNGSNSSNRSNALVVDWSGNLIAQGMAGMVQMFAGSTAPTGWLICNGAAVSRTTYATLFAVIGTTWGSGDGSSTFNLPDLRGRAPIGAGTGSGLTARSLAAKGGSENIQAHTHAFTPPTVKVKYSKEVAKGTAENHIDGGSSSSTDNPMVVSGGAVGAVSGVSTGNAGNMQPFAVINFIICTGKTS